jgi:hypothetical protein
LAINDAELRKNTAQGAIADTIKPPKIGPITRPMSVYCSATGIDYIRPLLTRTRINNDSSSSFGTIPSFNLVDV